MTEEEAAWVRENAWTQQMREQPVFLPGSSSATYDKAEALAQCDCQVGLCIHCRTDRHAACHRKRFGRPHPEDYLADVPVWLADRTCRSLCPCPCPRVMSPGEAAWVRNNVWSQAKRKCFRDNPGYHLKCSCQSGMSTWCQNGKHEECHRGTALPNCEAFITNRRDQVLYFPQQYEHPTLTATGAHRTSAAQVWLADRTCRWVCPCPCGHPAQDEPVTTPAPTRPARYELVPLPGLEVVGR